MYHQCLCPPAPFQATPVLPFVLVDTTLFLIQSLPSFFGLVTEDNPGIDGFNSLIPEEGFICE